jgi:MFS family permease
LALPRDRRFGFWAVAFALASVVAFTTSGCGRRVQVVSTGANLGGLGVGALISGALVQWAGHALLVPFAVFTVVLVLAFLALLSSPETRRAQAPRPRCHPQRVSVPAAARRRFLAAALGAPLIGLCLLTRVVSTRVSLLVFAGLLAVGILAAAPALLGHRRRPLALATSAPST